MMLAVTPSFGTLALNVLLALVITVAVLGIVVKVLQYFGFGRQPTKGSKALVNHDMSVINMLPISKKSFIAIVQVDDEQLLIGVTDHTITRLHQFDTPMLDDGLTDDIGDGMRADLGESAGEGTDAGTPDDVPSGNAFQAALAHAKRIAMGNADEQSAGRDGYNSRDSARDAGRDGYDTRDAGHAAQPSDMNAPTAQPPVAQHTPKELEPSTGSTLAHTIQDPREAHATTKRDEGYVTNSHIGRMASTPPPPVRTIYGLPVEEPVHTDVAALFERQDSASRQNGAYDSTSRPNSAYDSASRPDGAARANAASRQDVPPPPPSVLDMDFSGVRGRRQLGRQRGHDNPASPGSLARHNLRRHPQSTRSIADWD